MSIVTERDLARLREQTDLLLGHRGPDTKPQSAVRRGELLALARRTPVSNQISAAPTQADYNALQADVQAIMDTLGAISNRLGNVSFP